MYLFLILEFWNFWNFLKISEFSLIDDEVRVFRINIKLLSNPVAELKIRENNSHCRSIVLKTMNRSIVKQLEKEKNSNFNVENFIVMFIYWGTIILYIDHNHMEYLYNIIFIPFSIRNSIFFAIFSILVSLATPTRKYNVWNSRTWVILPVTISGLIQSIVNRRQPVLLMFIIRTVRLLEISCCLYINLHLLIFTFD